MSQEETVIKLLLTVDEVNVVLTALSKLPLENVVNVWAKIKQSAESQLIPQETTQ